MIELLIFAAGAATGAVALLLPYQRAVSRRDAAERAMKTCEAIATSTNEILNNRITVLKADNLALQAEVAKLTNTNVELQREVGRNAAEMRAATANVVKRDPATGRFLPNPNAKRPRAARRKPTAAC